MTKQTERPSPIAPRIVVAGVVVTGIVLAGIAVILWPRAKVEDPVEIIEQSAYIPPPPATPSRSPVVFTDVTRESGIDFRHFNGAATDSAGKPTRFMPETMGPGIALLDFDRDGDLDIFVPNSSTFDGNFEVASMSPRLFENRGDMTFADATPLLGENIISYWMGAAVADYDGDTYPDILLTGWGRMMLLKNNAGRDFSDVTERVLPAANNSDYPQWSTAALFFDADRDGDLDLYVANYVKWSPQDDLFATIDGQNKSYATPDLYHGGSSRLFMQQDGIFVDSTQTAGLLNDEGKSLGAALWDFDQNGLLDIVVANDTQPNFLYYNLGDGRFENRALAAGIAYDANGKTRAGMGIDVADLGNDGHVCIAIGNFSREPLSVFRDEGGGFFRESSQSAGVAESTYLPLTFGLSFADFDLDGWQDLVMANGHIEPEIEHVEAEITYKQPLQILGNTGSAHFENWSATAGEVFAKPIVGRGLAVGDLDNDGDIDIVATENNGGLHVLRNDKQSGNAYLRVALRGNTPNTHAIGAKIELVTAGGLRQQRIVKGGSSYLSQSEFVQTFGLGAEDQVASLQVTWPGGKQVGYRVETLNTTLVIDEDSPAVAVQ